jgi:DNA repair exonuclease SbcCD nuclease subunit
MKILIASDFHLGLRRKAHFTAESSQRREAAAFRVLTELLAQYPPAYPLICGGDLFDRYSNAEQVVMDAYHLLNQERPVAVLAGNHDVDQRVDTCSSLELLAAVCEEDDNRDFKVIRTGVAKTSYRDRQLVFVPHCLSQDLFLEALDTARRLSDPGAVLFLHCSYDLQFDTSHTALNLPRERAAELLEHFSLLFLGHEHVPREDFDRRLFVIGSHYPTAFDNLSDKRHLLLDPETLAVESVVHWRAADHVYRGPAEQASPGFDFYDLTEATDSKIPVALFKAGAMGVRVPGQELALGMSEPVTTMESLPERIAQDLDGHPELLELWLELRGRINA